jgi:hypothetical protein
MGRGLSRPETTEFSKAERTKKGHRSCLETLGRKGQQHRDTPMRNFLDLEDEFLERWDLLGLVG